MCNLCKKKQPYLADRHYLEHYGFQLVDEIFPYQLYYLPIKDTPQESDAIIPKFLEHARTLQCEEDGFVLYYSCQCPHAACYGEKQRSLLKKLIGRYMCITSRQQKKLNSFLVLQQLMLYFESSLYYA